MKEIFARRSVRQFTGEAVSEEQITKLLRAAMRAPSAGNEQPWHFVVMQKREEMEKVIRFHPYTTMLKEAPCAIVVCGDETLQKFDADYWVQDCSAATQNLLLEAVHLGLGAVWCAIYPERERLDGMRELLGLPGHVIPLNIIAIGHAAGETKPIDTYKPDRVHREKWGG